MKTDLLLPPFKLYPLCPFNYTSDLIWADHYSKLLSRPALLCSSATFRHDYRSKYVWPACPMWVARLTIYQMAIINIQRRLYFNITIIIINKPGGDRGSVVWKMITKEYCQPSPTKLPCIKNRTQPCLRSTSDSLVHFGL